MRDRMQRLVILPFSVGCISEASVAVGIPHPIRSSSRAHTNSPPPNPIRCKGDEDSESLSSESMKNSLGFLLVPKSNISTGFNRLFKGFKNLSQFFGEKDELESEVAMEMEIGCPTDVQHVTHIGWEWDGSATANPIPMRGWDNLIPPDHLLSLCNPLSMQNLKQPSPVPTSSEPASPPH